MTSNGSILSYNKIKELKESKPISPPSSPSSESQEYKNKIIYYSFYLEPKYKISLNKINLQLKPHSTPSSPIFSNNNQIIQREKSNNISTLNNNNNFLVNIANQQSNDNQINIQKYMNETQKSKNNKI